MSGLRVRHVPHLGGGPPREVATGNDSNHFVIADFDRDLVPDIATTDDSYNNEVTVVTGRGDGTFAPARSFAGAISPRWLAVGDLDGDLLPDLVTANASFGFLWGFGMLAGPFLSGGAMDIWDPHGFPAVLAAVTALVLAIAIYRRWQARGR